jgi:hypothetical protein
MANGITDGEAARRQQEKALASVHLLATDQTTKKGQG